MEHSSKERFGQPQTGGFDEEDARLQRLQEMQMVCFLGVTKVQ